jgi:hypothetical protein
VGQAKFLKDAYASRGELHPDAVVALDAAFPLATHSMTFAMIATPVRIKVVARRANGH